MAAGEFGPDLFAHFWGVEGALFVEGDGCGGDIFGWVLVGNYGSADGLIETVIFDGVRLVIKVWFRFGSMQFDGERTL